MIKKSNKVINVLLENILSVSPNEALMLSQAILNLVQAMDTKKHLNKMK